MILNRMLAGELTGVEAATLLGCSQRQVRRLLAAYGQGGPVALIHGNRGRQPAHTLPPMVRERIVALARETYAGCNDQHLTELLAEREQLQVSRSSVRRVLRAAGLASPRRRRAPGHRRRRERWAQAGMLLQADGSPHPWLETRGPVLTLLGAIDDATGQVTGALFRVHEDAHGYLLLLRQIARSHGLPLAWYSDRHGIFARASHAPESLAEQLAGRPEPTQFGRALQELGIQSILAHSPQAKGRVERLWGTFQDRLVSELRLAGATTLEQASAVLADFLPRFNERFGVPAAQPGSAWRAWPEDLDPERVFCFKYVRTVAADNTVTLGPHTLQLAPDRHRASYARAKVELHERLDGSLAVYFQDRCLTVQPAPPVAPTLRARKGRRGSSVSSPPVPPQTAPAPPRPAPAPSQPTRPSPRASHPWRRYASTKKRADASVDTPARSSVPAPQPYQETA